MKASPRSARWLGLFFALAAVAPACRYGVNPDTGKFHCASDSDCGGGWHCFSSCQASSFSAYCAQDGSCDACPSLDEDPQNCGSCGTVCPSGDGCIDGICVPSLLPDAGQPDAGDAGLDGGIADAGIDGGEDAGRDAGEDAGIDGGKPDGSVDAGEGRDGGEPDASVDGGLPDASIDGGLEDAGEDGGASVDAGDGGADSGE